LDIQQGIKSVWRAMFLSSGIYCSVEHGMWLEWATLLLIPHAKGFTNHNRVHLHNESMKVQLAYFISRAKILMKNLISLCLVKETLIDYH